MRHIVMPLIVPFVIALIGTGWMVVAVNHYERATAHELDGLAGHHYSMPEWGFQYRPGGEAIADRTVVYPPNITFLALACSATIFTIRRWGSVWQIVAVVWTHATVASAFAVLAVWFWVNVMGVFI